MYDEWEAAERVLEGVTGCVKSIQDGPERFLEWNMSGKQILLTPKTVLFRNQYLYTLWMWCKKKRTNISWNAGVSVNTFSRTVMEICRWATVSSELLDHVDNWILFLFFTQKPNCTFLTRHIHVKNRDRDFNVSDFSLLWNKQNKHLNARFSWNSETKEWNKAMCGG